jgi:hypothetical protein
MWDPKHLTTLQASISSSMDSFYYYPKEILSMVRAKEDFFSVRRLPLSRAVFPNLFDAADPL